jgi:D-beta-D-heptose 7-phosphate kinase/D-beta-D-heptose 1-phosphate adenosyltransferase
MDSIRYVYDVVGFSTDDELRQQIKDWETDVMIVGSDYKDKNVIGSELVKEVIFFDRIEGYSTTNTLKNV